MGQVRDLWNHYWGTTKHKGHVARNLLTISAHLAWRALVHDISKYGRVEASTFARVSPQFAHHEHGSEGYKRCLKELGVALEHHYRHNRHHPEFFRDSDKFIDADHKGNAICEMNLIDVIEMVCDWKAASLRHPGSNLTKSIEVQEERFGVRDQLMDIMLNTARDLDW